MHVEMLKGEEQHGINSQRVANVFLADALFA